MRSPATIRAVPGLCIVDARGWAAFVISMRSSVELAFFETISSKSLDESGPPPAKVAPEPEAEPQAEAWYGEQEPTVEGVYVEMEPER